MNGLSMSYNQIGTSDAAGRGYLPSVEGANDFWFYFNGLIDEFFMYSSALQ